MKLTKQILFIGMIVLGIYDFAVFVFGGEATTVSQVMTDYLSKSILGVIVFCLIFGHWLWPMKVKVEVQPDYSRLKKAWENYQRDIGIGETSGWVEGNTGAELRDAIDELVNGGKKK